ncbi:MAG: EamA family transporter [Nanoarchaeota archaeon]|nr:EamA family transporter [Nanoarchaeota archaeon]
MAISWLIFSIISAFCESIKSILHRKVMITQDPYAYALFENIFAAIIFLFFINRSFFPNEFIAWFIVLISSLLWLSLSIIAQFSYKYTKVSIQEPLKQTRIIWVFLFGIIFLSEVASLNKFLGTLLIIIGLVYLSYEKKNKFGSLNNKGVLFTLLTAFLFAIVTIVDKYALNYFNAETYGFLVYLFPGIALIIINKSKKNSNILSLIKNFWLIILIVALSSFGFYYFKLKALELADASLVFPIIRSATILTVLGGIIFLNEKENIVKKIISSLIVFVGILLLSF